ncbi:hypothetical protein CC78DRAFT_542248 [Lojkania enalia]|uniref:Small EDRK-rich factor-like N-terminal domain-containing protein n=1 Tax=Lojkania enalia TaxID=147567 RepID=A0A9P4N8U4_9PLEO|nr:hypothetical protein CC78DRAFT_542248 [Didymosphaeria enalia]
MFLESGEVAQPVALFLSVARLSQSLYIPLTTISRAHFDTKSSAQPIEPLAKQIKSGKEMARGNQRDKAREKNLKEQARQAQKSKNTQSGTEFARTKEDQAAIMRAKQAAADAKKAEASAAGGKKK